MPKLVKFDLQKDKEVDPLLNKGLNEGLNTHKKNLQFIRQRSLVLKICLLRCTFEKKPKTRVALCAELRFLFKRYHRLQLNFLPEFQFCLYAP
jgi:hypothetical protein